MYCSKHVKIIFVGSAKEEYIQLNEIVGEEVSKGIENSDHQILLRSIKQKEEFLRANPQYGIHISKNKIPKEYIENYDVNNLWKVNLSNAWRMIYTIRGNSIEIITIVLGLMDHRDYEKKFGYRKS